MSDLHLLCSHGRELTYMLPRFLTTLLFFLSMIHLPATKADLRTLRAVPLGSQGPQKVASRESFAWEENMVSFFPFLVSGTDSKAQKC